MKQSEILIGKICTHPDLKLVTVDGVHEKSRVLLDVTVIDRGKGYNEIRGKYTGVRISTGWYRGQNREFGNKDFVHYQTLKINTVNRNTYEKRTKLRKQHRTGINYT